MKVGKVMFQVKVWHLNLQFGKECSDYLGLTERRIIKDQRGQSSPIMGKDKRGSPVFICSKIPFSGQFLGRLPVIQTTVI